MREKKDGRTSVRNNNRTAKYIITISSSTYLIGL